MSENVGIGQVQDRIRKAAESEEERLRRIAMQEIKDALVDYLGRDIPLWEAAQLAAWLMTLEARGAPGWDWMQSLANTHGEAGRAATWVSMGSSFRHERVHELERQLADKLVQSIVS